MTDTDVQDTGEDTVNNVSDTTGSDNNQDTQKSDAKTFTQADVNNIIKQKQAEWKTKYKAEFDKTLQGKHVLTEDELDARLKDAVTATLNEESLKSTRAQLQTEYGLSEYQISKLEGDDEKSLRADAEKTYGKPKKEAPVLNGGKVSDDGEPSKNASLNQWLRDTMPKTRK